MSNHEYPTPPSSLSSNVKLLLARHTDMVTDVFVAVAIATSVPLRDEAVLRDVRGRRQSVRRRVRDVGECASSSPSDCALKSEMASESVQSAPLTWSIFSRLRYEKMPPLISHTHLPFQAPLLFVLWLAFVVSVFSASPSSALFWWREAAVGYSTHGSA